jgi:ABC-type amino acid transport substrate-binding protein
MLPSLNRALEEMRASGTLSELVKTWFPETIDLPVLNR